MVNLGPTFFNQRGILVPNANVIGLLYQFSVLIIPSLAPVLVWAWQARDTPLIGDILGAINAAGETSN